MFFGPAPDCDVRNDRNDEHSRSREQRASAARRPAEGKEFWRRRVSATNPSGARLLMDPASEKSSPAVDRAVGDHRYPVMQRGTTRAEEDPVIITSRARVRSATSPAMQPTDLAAAAQPKSGTVPGLPIAQARRFSWSRELICDIRIGPRENSPTSAFRVSPRK